MASRTVRNLRELTEERTPLTRGAFELLRKRLWKQIEWPELRTRARGRLRHGESLEIGVDRLALPRVDYYAGRLVDVPSAGPAHPIVATFQSVRGTIHTPVQADRERKVLTVTVPVNAVAGAVTLLYPIEEYYGPTPELREIDRRHGVLGDHVGLWQDDGEECCAPSKAKRMIDLCEYPEHLEVEFVAVRHVEFFLGLYSVQCETCSVECPHGAIRFDKDGDCYVDVETCRGQKYVTDRSPWETSGGTEMYARVDEESCWECCEGDEIVSTKCTQGRLRRVAYNNGMCCGGCNYFSEWLGLGFMELCDQGAISRVPGTSFDWMFQVDPSLCTGCMACYNGLNCYHNTDSNTTVRMVAYLDPPVLRYIDYYPSAQVPRGRPLGNLYRPSNRRAVF
jgi:hypothetical protein